MARPAARAPTAQSRRTNDRLTGYIQRLPKVVQKSRARLSNPRAAGSQRRRRANPAPRAKAARLAGFAAPRTEPRRLDRQDRGCALGRGAPAYSRDIASELHLSAPQAARDRDA